jgi:hypothetical protein
MTFRPSVGLTSQQGAMLSGSDHIDEEAGLSTRSTKTTKDNEQACDQNRTHKWGPLSA